MFMFCCMFSLLLIVYVFYLLILLLFFFFKQKTAYEMRISDWSSDVCSSDLDRGEYLRFLVGLYPARAAHHAEERRQNALAAQPELCAGPHRHAHRRDRRRHPRLRPRASRRGVDGGAGSGRIISRHARACPCASPYIGRE